MPNFRKLPYQNSCDDCGAIAHCEIRDDETSPLDYICDNWKQWLSYEEITHSDIGDNCDTLKINPCENCNIHYYCCKIPGTKCSEWIRNA